MYRKIDYIQMIGEKHTKISGKNEDVVLIEENEQFLFLGIADGKSGCNYSKEGGEISLKTLFHYIIDNGICHIIDGRYRDEKKYEIVRTIRRALEKEAIKLNIDDEEMSSTIVVIVVDKINQQFLTIHLGDGCIVGLNTNKKVIMLSPPCNGVTASYTWLTTDEEAPHYMRFVHGDLKDFTSVYLMSDGVDCICYGRDILLEGERILKTEDSKEIFDFIEKSEPWDDATCVFLKINM